MIKNTWIKIMPFIRWVSLWLIPTLGVILYAKISLGEEWANIFIVNVLFSIVTLGVMSYVWIIKESSKLIRVTFSCLIITIHYVLCMLSFAGYWYSLNDAIIGLYIYTFIEGLILAILIVAKLFKPWVERNIINEYKRSTFSF
ncbi:hypothetical protein MRY82_10390 [bacterium]|nr:hypothetical protein [bacterium]